MALDVGDARVGIAISDPLGLSAQPYPAIERKKDFFKNLQKLIEEKAVKTLVLGLPLELDGAYGPQAKKVEDFRTALLKELRELNLKVDYLDERMTTIQAERVLQGSKLKNKEKSAALDSISAALILESYLLKVTI